ncbi:MAG TPA: hypothetical protein VJ761_11315, partial [Ktedonobacteraceae bacterium]|nr:hypothetical protein [Ktedonobacteraceae bacterium]
RYRDDLHRRSHKPDRATGRQGDGQAGRPQGCAPTIDGTGVYSRGAPLRSPCLPVSLPARRPAGLMGKPMRIIPVSDLAPR